MQADGACVLGFVEAETYLLDCSPGLRDTAPGFAHQAHAVQPPELLQRTWCVPEAAGVPLAVKHHGHERAHPPGPRLWI